MAATSKDGWAWRKRAPLREILPKLETWLRANFPTPYPVRCRYLPEVRYRTETVAGLCWREGRRFQIRVLNRGATKREVTETLIHEWMHAHTWRHEKVESHREQLDGCHDDVFWLAYGRAYRLLYDEDAWDEVQESEP